MLRCSQKITSYILKYAAAQFLVRALPSLEILIFRDSYQ
jgi:hypothetical protein